MNIKEKLEEATIKALGGKLGEARSHPFAEVGDTDIRGYGRDLKYSDETYRTLSKVRDIVVDCFEECDYGFSDDGISFEDCVNENLKDAGIHITIKDVDEGGVPDTFIYRGTNNEIKNMSVKDFNNYIFFDDYEFAGHDKPLGRGFNSKTNSYDELNDNGYDTADDYYRWAKEDSAELNKLNKNLSKTKNYNKGKVIQNDIDWYTKSRNRHLQGNQDAKAGIRARIEKNRRK